MSDTWTVDEHARLTEGDLLLSGDCRDRFKHGSCAGEPCQCRCHAEPA